MSCTEGTCNTENPWVCGTGEWTGPKPGDPDTSPGSVSLSATGDIGGNHIRWTLPEINGHAVAHTIIYRGLSNNFTAAVNHVIGSGSYYFDRISDNEIQRYYYWVRLVTVNGTQGELIGPASALPISRKEGTLESLTEEIDAGKLAEALRMDIGRITTLGSDLLTEINRRIAADELLGGQLELVQEGLNTAFAYIQDEITSRVTADSSLVNSIELMAAQVNENAALINEEKTLRVSADEAFAEQAALLYATKDELESAVLTEATARVEADAEIVGQINSLASHVTTVQNTFQENIASVQTSLQTEISHLDNEVTNIGALYTTRVSVNGLVGGFGIYNNGQIVEAGFDVDRFWIGRTNADKVKPFIIDQGIVYIDKARIKNADIDTLKIAGGAVTSSHYSPLAWTAYEAPGTEKYLGTVSLVMPANSSGVVLWAHAGVGTMGGANGVELRIYKGGPSNKGSLVGYAMTTADGNRKNMMVSAFDPSPAEGTQQYSVWMYVMTQTGASVATWDGAMVATGGKR